ncbi:MAG: VOC family protein [Pseudomonadota bacterium]
MINISHITFHTLPVTDQDRALAFWRDVMGFEVSADAEYMPGQRWIMLRPWDARTNIHLDQVDEMPERDKPAIPFVCPDVDEAVTHLKSKDVEIVQDPAPAPWDADTVFAMFNDSEGNLVLLSSK